MRIHLPIYLSSLIVIFFFNSSFSQPLGDYDIHCVDVKTGKTQQLTKLKSTDEFNPSFSPDTKNVVHDVVGPVRHDLFVTNVKTGKSFPLIGGDGGCDASWSPNGKYIAFDRSPVGDENIYYVPSSGGKRILIRENANDPHWANNSDRLVFSVEDGIRTILKNGKGETSVSDFGHTPAYGPNGQYIAFGDGTDIWKIRVDKKGNPLGPPINVSNNIAGNHSAHPSWSNNSKTLVSSTGSGTMVDIMTIPSSGGSHNFLADVDSNPDFDPSFSNNGKKVAFSGKLNAPSIIVRNNRDRKSIPKSTNYPNPFGTSTTISFELDQENEVGLYIFDQRGNMVITLREGLASPGVHEIEWHGDDEKGTAFPSGVYFLSMYVGTYIETHQIVLIRE